MKKKIASWKGILVIACLVLAAVCYWIAEYRPTKYGQINWEVTAGIFLGGFIGAIVFSFIKFPPSK